MTCKEWVPLLVILEPVSTFAKMRFRHFGMYFYAVFSRLILRPKETDAKAP